MPKSLRQPKNENRLPACAGLRFRYVFLVLFCPLLSCEALLEPFKPTTVPNPCDPTSSVYQAKHHYFERDFLKVDGSIDYDKLAKLTQPQASPCDPLYDPNLVHTNPKE